MLFTVVDRVRSLKISTTQLYILLGVFSILLFLTGLGVSFVLFETRVDLRTLRTFLIGFSIYMLFYFTALVVYYWVDRSS